MIGRVAALPAYSSSHFWGAGYGGFLARHQIPCAASPHAQGRVTEASRMDTAYSQGLRDRVIVARSGSSNTTVDRPLSRQPGVGSTGHAASPRTWRDNASATRRRHRGQDRPGSTAPTGSRTTRCDHQRTACPAGYRLRRVSSRYGAAVTGVGRKGFPIKDRYSRE